MPYVDGFVIPVPRKNIDSYRRMSRAAGKIWIDHGALEYRECVGDDLDAPPMGRSFPRGIRSRPGETVVFSWIVYKSREHRDRVNAKVMKDERLAKMMTPDAMPFDATSSPGAATFAWVASAGSVRSAHSATGLSLARVQSMNRIALGPRSRSRSRYALVNVG